MRSARAGSLRNALGSLAVLGVVALIAFGLPFLDRSLPASRALTEGRAYDVGAQVSMVPPGGASVDVTGTRPGADRGTALFVVGGVRLVVVVSPYRGTLAEAETRLQAKITQFTGFQVTGAGRPASTAQGVAGLKGAYSSPGRLGEYAVFVADGKAVEVTASGPEDALRTLSPSIAASVRTVVFGGAA